MEDSLSPGCCHSLGPSDSWAESPLACTLPWVRPVEGTEERRGHTVGSFGKVAPMALLVLLFSVGHKHLQNGMENRNYNIPACLLGRSRVGTGLLLQRMGRHRGMLAADTRVADREACIRVVVVGGWWSGRWWWWCLVLSRRRGILDRRGPLPPLLPPLPPPNSL